MENLDYNQHRPMPKGIAYCGNGPLEIITKDLLKIAAFLQSIMLFGPDRLIRYDDWWEHDDLHFKKGRTDLHELFTILKTPRTLYDSMPGDDDVFIGIGPEDESWYLRFYVDWDINDKELVGAFAAVFKNDLADQFKKEVISKLESNILEIDSSKYYERICDGECSI
ncbi:MAG: hypothetical protein PVG39_22155 [Desulfobacteraceae bacterium]